MSEPYENARTFEDIERIYAARQKRLRRIERIGYAIIALAALAFIFGPYIASLIR